MAKELVAEAPAKINLTLDVKGKRTDGYHELETVMHAVNLVDRIVIKTAPEGINISSNSNAIPDNEENLAYKAAALILGNYGAGEGVNIYIEKNIPVGAGLAGGSTDAAAVLTGINHLYNYGLSEKELLALAARIGSDVSFCVSGGTMLACGRGEVLTPLAVGPVLDILLVKPDFSISTADVYRDFNIEKVEIFPDTSAFIEAWNNCDIINITSNMVNVLETVCLPKYPQIAVIKDELRELGALNSVMSGSGSTVFGIFRQKDLALRAYDMLKTRYQEVYLVSSYNRGD